MNICLVGNYEIIAYLIVVSRKNNFFQDSIDHWEPREGLALALHNLAPYFKDSTLVEKVTNFLVKEVTKNHRIIYFLIIFVVVYLY